MRTAGSARKSASPADARESCRCAPNRCRSELEWSLARRCTRPAQRASRARPAASSDSLLRFCQERCDIFLLVTATR